MRITDKDLNAVVKRLNEITNSPIADFTRLADGTYRANIGNYHLYFAYGKVGMHRMGNASGGTSEIFGLTTKRELYDQIHAYLKGILSRGL